MNKLQLLEIVTSEKNITTDDVIALKQVLDTYPYFTGAAYALAKYFHQNNDFQFQHQLKLTATLSPNRKMLYKYLNIQKQINNDLIEKNEITASNVTEEMQISTQEPTPNLGNGVVEVIDVEPVAKETLETIVDTNSVDETSIVISNTSESSDTLVDEIVNDKVIQNEVDADIVFDIATHQKKEYHESDDIELSHEEKEDIPTIEIKVEEITSSKKDDEVEKNVPFESLQNAVDLAPIQHNVDINILTTAIENSISVDEFSRPNLDIDTKNEYSFTDWLKQRKFAEKQESKNVILNTEKEIPVTKIEKVKADEILEKFIETQPRISKPKVEFYSPVNMARQSVADTDELATETLATIYLAQGNYSKAIKVYEALIAKHPDRKNYFSALIKKAREKNQSKKG